MPLIRRLPKFGFTNPFTKQYAIINLRDLVRLGLEGEVTPQKLVERGAIMAKLPLKVLGYGELDRSLTISASKFSKSALEKIEKAGGKAVVIKNGN